MVALLPQLSWYFNPVSLKQAPLALLLPIVVHGLPVLLLLGHHGQVHRQEELAGHLAG